MARASSNKSVPVTAAKFKSSSTTRSRSGSRRSAKDKFELIDQLFHSYSNTVSGVIEPEGIEALCSDLEVEHTDVRILLLAWKMQAKKQGYFTKDEWRVGLNALANAETLPRLKKALPLLLNEINSAEMFLDFYTFSFNYCLTEEKQKHLDVESCCLLLHLILGSRFRPQVDSLTEYLQVQGQYRVISRDHWMGFFRFCREVNFPELDNYNEDHAWPLLLDNFVEWARGRMQKTPSP